MLLKVLLVLLALAALPAQGRAQSPADIICAGVEAAITNGDLGNQILTEDPDGDGLINYFECKGTVDEAGNRDQAAAIDWPGLLSAPVADKEPLDPTKPNVFFFIKPLPAAETEFPDDPRDLLKHLVKPRADMGLGIVPLFIDPDEFPVGTCPNCPSDPIQDRAITRGEPTSLGFMSTWSKAVRITESKDISDIYLWGKCKQGTPLYLDNCTINTHAIRLGLAEKCARYDSCEFVFSESSLDRVVYAPYENNDVFDAMVKETAAKIAAHEGGHTLWLSLNCSNKTGICHNKGSGEVMEAFVVFKRGKWKMGTYFDSNNVDGFKMYE